MWDIIEAGYYNESAYVSLLACTVNLIGHGDVSPIDRIVNNFLEANNELKELGVYAIDKYDSANKLMLHMFEVARNKDKVLTSIKNAMNEKNANQLAKQLVIYRNILRERN